jgi:hypothetical protein
MTWKSRITATETWRSPQLISSGVPQNVGGVVSSYNLFQNTNSENHRWRGNSFKGVDIGGGFSTEKMKFETSHRQRFTLKTRLASQQWRDGNIYALLPSGSEFEALGKEIPFFGDSTMDSWGTTAISQTYPTKSEAQLAVAAGELVSGGLPSIIGKSLLKSQLKDYRKVGDEYLNVEFGIKPLISDIQATAQSIVNAEKRLAQLERDSGRLVRRRFAFPDLSEEFKSVATGAAAVPSGWTNPYLYESTTGHRKETTTYFDTKRWFSGAFTYHVKLGSTQRTQLANAAQEARLLLGVKLDAEVLWNLTPWSWLADWFGNMGDIMTNVSAFQKDGLVMPYGYVMSHQKATKRSVLSGLWWRDPAGPKVVTSTLTFERKQRRKAHPYGFGVTDAMLDSRQLAILGALGISNGPRRW